MADVVIGATIEVLFDRILSLATDRIGQVLGSNDELENLKKSVGMIQAVLADADNKQTHNPAVKLWLKNLEGVAFEADHVLDELHYENLRREVEQYRNQQLEGNNIFSYKRIKTESQGYIRSFANYAFRWSMPSSKVRDITTKLENINQEADRHHHQATN